MDLDPVIKRQLPRAEAYRQPTTMPDGPTPHGARRSGIATHRYTKKNIVTVSVKCCYCQVTVLSLIMLFQNMSAV